MQKIVYKVHWDFLDGTFKMYLKIIATKLSFIKTVKMILVENSYFLKE